MHINLFPQKTFSHTHKHVYAQIPFYTGFFLHTDAWFTHRKFHKQNLLRTNALTHTVETFVRGIFHTKKPIHRAALARKQIIQSSLYTLQNCSSNAILHLWPSFPAKGSLKFHMQAAKMTVRSKDSPTAATLHRETGNGKGKRDNNGSTGTGQGDNGTTAWGSTDSLGNEGQQIRPATPIDPKTKGRNNTGKSRHQPGNKTTALRDPKETYKIRTPSKSRSHGRRMIETKGRAAKIIGRAKPSAQNHTNIRREHSLKEKRK